MSWSWRSQSLRHVPRPKNIISSHSGILDAFVAASLCFSVSPCCSFVLVVESVGQALFNPSLLFIKKEKRKKEYICASLYRDIIRIQPSAARDILASSGSYGSHRGNAWLNIPKATPYRAWKTMNMNHHLPAMPHGQPPMPPRRQQDLPYTTGPPNLRSPPPYMGYHPHMNGHPPPPYSPQQYPQWYPAYPQQMQMPPRQYHQPAYAPINAPMNAPMIVSSYPPTQPVMAPAHIPPPSLHLQPRTSTPLPATMSPVAPVPPMDLPEHPPVATVPVNPSPAPAVSSSPPATGGLKGVPYYPPLPGPFRAPVPWLSVPEQPFPARAPRRRRAKDRTLLSSVAVELPTKGGQGEKQSAAKRVGTSAQASSEPQTPTLSAGPSDANSTQPTTPSPAPQKQSTQPQSQSKTSKPAVPVVPIVPVVPATSGTPRQPAKDDTTRAAEPSKPDTAEAAKEPPTENVTSEEQEKPSSSPRAAPKSWADLLKSKAASKAAAAPSTATETNGLVAHKAKPLADVLTGMGDDVTEYSDKVAFLEPRGLVNTGNMCYMNSVLQVLVSCVPFYRFLDHLGRQAAHSIQSDFPLIDAMIMFLREFRVIDAAQSEEQLRLRLKPNELEEYGDSFIPEFVYQMIRQLPRFRDMRRGHQQDAQEFLGFLLEEMHEECARAAKHTSTAKAQEAESQGTEAAGQAGDGWLEVGHKQKPAVTQSSGDISQETPITRIFGGKIRSEFKVPGNKTSVTLEPYQSLQLDIGSSDVHNIVDALKGLTKSESIQGEFSSSRGSNVTATKQIFIESLPPVLILHLKRFQYDSVTQGTQKIWKKIGYPLDLEVPREVFPPHRRNALMAHGGLPKYRLIGVIYHHGKNASGGHYTVDARRQDGREWIRLDDTVIRRVKSGDVAEAGSEEDPKALAAALEQHKRDKDPNANIFDHIVQDEHPERGWSQVNGTGANGHSSKKSTSAAPSSGPAPSSRGPRTELRDNKVAYLLLYEQIA